MNSSITPPTIQFDNVTIAFDEHTILNDISVTLSERRIAIIGANGSGKSTFVRMVNG
ncbi:ATP-binding cassette domain-containing protein, partial [Klebsiella pneumoniae]|uniref:ATP-binding cassette domain-containing protein n=2 Tax=Bacteria TaxID=2 RepID=UPI0010AA2356